MNDRELLEAAARAAGLTSHRYCEAWKAMAFYDEAEDHFDGESWNPLTDDGDALRLAVRLAFTVVIQPHETEVFHPDGGCLASEHVFSFPTESYAATRRAITRAAAEIGKNMTSA